MKLGLGTAQFGLDYGISNREGKTSEEEAGRILACAKNHGVSVIDTSPSYGSSEIVLGKCISDNHGFNILTKTPIFGKPSIYHSDVQLLYEVFLRSLHRLRRVSAYGLLIHRPEDLLCKGGALLMEKMAEMKQSGLVRKIGVSVYTGKQIDLLLDHFRFDVIQLPINVLDQRLLEEGYLIKLKKSGMEIHARSAFLQGLLLMDPKTLPSCFQSVREHLRRYHDLVRDWGVKPVQAALGFLLGIEQIDIIICGVNNHFQFEEICSGLQPLKTEDFQKFSWKDEFVLNPSLWRY